MTTHSHAVTYWDSSAVVSALLRDDHTDHAKAESQRRGAHLLSSLSWVETLAIIGRAQRDGAVPVEQIEAAHRLLATRTWRRVNVEPRWEAVLKLAASWPLRGADLWHLAAAKRLKEDLPNLRLLTFDKRLLSAAQGEGLA